MLSLALVALVAVAVGLRGCGCLAGHALLLQSFDELVLECAELLAVSPSLLDGLRRGSLAGDTDTRCLVRCVGVNGRFWSDHAGLRMDVLARYFTAAPGDSQNVNRTQACLDRGLDLRGLDRHRKHPGCCDRAFEAFLCFYHNYGNLHRHRVFVPLDSLQLLHVTARCMEVQGLTVEQLTCLGADELDANRNVHCLVRCMGVRTGIYSDWLGADVDRIYAQYGEGHDERQYKERAYACLARHAGNGTGLCRRAYDMLYKCFENVRNVITEFEIPDSDESPENVWYGIGESDL